MPIQDESPAARWRALIADDRLWWSVLAVAFVVTAAVSSQLGGYTDDLFHALVGRDYSWWELASFKAGPYGMAMGVWKLAVALAPARPWVPVLLFSALLHVLITAMIAPLLEHLMARSSARTWALLALVFRPALEPLWWGAAQGDVLVAAFSVAALLVWSRGPGRPALRWAGCLLAMAALVAKPSALLLPVLFLAWAMLIENDERPLRQRREVWLPLLLTSGFFAFYGLAAAWNRGPWNEIYDQEVSLLEGLPVIGMNLARGLMLIRPVALVSSPAFGWLMLAASAGGLLFGNGRLRFGLLWAGSFVSISAMATGLVGGRYLFPAIPGYLIVFSAIYEWCAARAPSLKRAAQAGLCVFVLLCCAALVRDVRYRSCWGEVFDQARSLITDNASAFEQGVPLEVVHDSQPVTAWAAQISEYEFSKQIVSAAGHEECSSPSAACLVYGDALARGAQAATGRYPAGECSAFVELRMPR